MASVSALFASLRKVVEGNWTLWQERLREKLWVRPLLYSLGATAAVSLCSLLDIALLAVHLPDIEESTIAALLQVLTASMLGVATFSVTSMVGAYSSVGQNATPRAFALVIADDISKSALSTFLGSFIFGTIGIIALRFGQYGVTGRFALFAMTLLVYAAVILIFVRWVDSVARLGRMGTTIRRVEEATAAALEQRRRHPHLRCAPLRAPLPDPQTVTSESVGYIQHIDLARLSAAAEAGGAHIKILATQGALVTLGAPLASGHGGAIDPEAVRRAFEVGPQRRFSSDPRFGLVTLSQIASRALSPGINDPGTAIDILATQTRLLSQWSLPPEGDHEVLYPRLRLPALAPAALLDDAFGSIARDGAAMVEVAARLQVCLAALARCGDAELARAAGARSDDALERALAALGHPRDRVDVEAAARAVQELIRARAQL